MLTDTHAHLYWDSFEEDFDDMLKRAINAGVSTIINVGVDIEKSEQALKQVQNLEKDPKWQNIKFFSTIGIHPHESVKYSDNPDVSIHQDITKLEQIYQSNISRCIAVGECGLDFFFPSPVIPSVSEKSLDSSPSAQNDRIDTNQMNYSAVNYEVSLRASSSVNHSSPKPAARHSGSRIKNLQRKLFQTQIDLAKKLNLPLIVHCRDDRSKNSENSEAWDECIEMTKNHFGIYHCYSGLLPTTNYIIQNTHFLVSFTANITYPKNEYLRDAAKIIPLDRIVLETDSPFLAPQSNRGKRNEPANVVEVAQTIAEVKGISLEEVASKTSENVAKLLRMR